MPLTQVNPALIESGTYATAAQGAKADSALQSLPAGSVLQVVSTITGAMATGTTTIPLDDTIPQITEGTEFLTRAITPAAASNLLKVDVTLVLNSNFAGSVTVIAALFRDSTANALAAVPAVSGTAVGYTTISFSFITTAGSTSATTFRVRAGAASASTVTLNGSGGARQLGGVMASSIVVTEIKA